MTAGVTELRVGRRRDDGPLPTGTPQLSWITESDAPGWMQRAAELALRLEGEDEEQLFAHPDGESSRLAWPFAALTPGTRATLRVRVQGTDGEWSAWSAERALTVGTLGSGEWVAEHVSHPSPEHAAEPFLVRVPFTVQRAVRRATLVATARGVYQAYVNGVEVDDAVLKPGWTPYAERLTHEWTEVGGLLATGENVLGLTVAGGWFTEEYGFSGHGRRVYGEQADVAAQLMIEYVDGTRETVATGAGSLAARGERRGSSIYHGEHVDARERIVDWSRPGAPLERWRPAATVSGAPTPRPAEAEPVRRTEELAVQQVLTTPSGKTVLDFGQNLVGRLRITVRGAAGDIVTLRHAEVLEHGELGIRPLRAARATDSYTLAGGGVEVWEPQFTFHGFRYAEISGWPGVFDPAEVTAIVLHSDMRRSGWFACSSPQLERLHENVVWSMRGNFLSLPTDCPQRDERLGWTGDIQVFAPTAASLFDCDAFLASWMSDLAIEQSRHDGIVPFVIPDVFPSEAIAAAAWGDAATVVPHVLFERFGDRELLAAQFTSMAAWSDRIHEFAGESLIWSGGFQFGDWLDPDAPADFPDEAKTPADLVATAYLFRSTALTARAAAELGHDVEARRYAERAERIRHAFLDEFVTPAGRIESDSPTAYALAIVFGIVEEARRQEMGRRVAALCRAAAYHLGTGFVGTPIILDALCTTGHAEAAGRLLTQTGNPSWLYAVSMGATTTWERWDSMLDDGSINPGEMTSFNHYAFGAVADWLHRGLAGLGPAVPGYRRVRIAPTLLAGIDHARAAQDTPYGRVESGWRRVSANEVEVRAVIAANTRAEVLLPDGRELEVGAGTHEWMVAAPVAPSRPVGLDDPVTTLVDDAAALESVRQVLLPHGDAWALFRRQLRRSPGASVRETLAALILNPGLDELVGPVLAG